ncbi:MAG: hypothetical protein LWY06_04420 [Firmicutes bacterium]|nr:hypothetical protein [Bacillota bacterium]
MQKNDALKVFAGRVWETSFFLKAGFPKKELYPFAQLPEKTFLKKSFLRTSIPKLLELGTDQGTVGLRDRQREPRFFKKARLPSEPPSLKNKSIWLEIGVCFTNSVVLRFGAMPMN